MKLPNKPYTPSWAMRGNHVALLFKKVRKEQEERRKAENAQQQVTRPEEWR